jgi:hypothetical protein
VTSKDESAEGTEAKTAKVDPDSMSAPDQLEVQQLNAQRDAAHANGDKQAVKDIDARLAQLTNPK